MSAGLADAPTSGVGTEKYTAPPAEIPSLGPLAKKILPHIFKLYDLSAGPSDYEVYSKDATFEDPLMKANGLESLQNPTRSLHWVKVLSKQFPCFQIKQIKSAFYSMQSLFSEAAIKEYSVSETSSGDSSGQVVVDNLQHYKAFGRSFDVTSRINLDVKDGLVVSHQDMWDKKPLATSKSSGFGGWIAQGCRSANMAVTHVLMGFGKDPKPRNS